MLKGYFIQPEVLVERSERLRSQKLLLNSEVCVWRQRTSSGSRVSAGLAAMAALL